jgi:hypothetical protein
MARETTDMFNVTDFEISNNGGPYTGRVIPQDVFRDIERLSGSIKTSLGRLVLRKSW